MTENQLYQHFRIFSVFTGLSTYGDSKADGCSLRFDKYSYDKTYNVQQKTVGSTQELIDTCTSSDERHDSLQEKLEQADHNLLPNCSQMGVDISHSVSLAQKKTSDDISRLLADCLQHKYSSRVDSNTSPDSCPMPETSAKDHDEETHETLTNIRTEARSNLTNSLEYTNQSPDFVAKDHLGLSPGQREKSALTNEESEHFQHCPSENNDGHINSEQFKESENKEAIGDVYKAERHSVGSSPPLINYDNLLAKYSTPTDGDVHKFDHASLYTTGQNEAVENCAHASESATYSKSNLEEMLECNNLLENHLTNGDVKSNNKSCNDLPDSKLETVGKDCCVNLTNKQEITILSASDIISSASSKNPNAHTNISEKLSHSSTDSAEEERDVASPKESSQENKPNSTSPAFDIATLMAKYCEEKSETISVFNQTPTSIPICNQENSCAIIKTMVLEDESAVLAYESKSNEKQCEILSEEDFEYDHLKPNPESKMNQSSVEETFFSEEEIYSAKIDYNLSMEGNIKPKAQYIEKDEENILKRPSNNQNEKESEFCSVYVPQSEEQVDLATPKDLKGSNEEKDKLSTPLTEKPDYMTKISDRMSSFGERFADISNLTGLYLSNEENKDNREVRNCNIPTITNVLPMAVDDDKIVEKGSSDSHEELEERRSQTIFCSAKIEPDTFNDPRMNINEPLVETEIKSSLSNLCHTPKPEDENIESVDESVTYYDTKLKENNNEDSADTLKFAAAAPEETPLSNVDTNPLEGGQIDYVDELSSSGYDNIKLLGKPVSIKGEDESVPNDLHNLPLQVEPPFERNESFDEGNISPNDYNYSDECTASKTLDHEPNNNFANENCDFESIKTLSEHNEHLELKDRLKINDDETVPNEMNESNCKCEKGNFSTETHCGIVELDYGQDFPQNNDNYGDQIQEISGNTALSKIPPPESYPSPKEETVPEILPSERIDTIKKQIYEEGLKPCQRDGGVAFFIPVSNTGLQPPVSNPEIGERLAKPKK